MRQAWEGSSLGELCEIKIGRTPKRADETLWDPDKTTSNVWLSIADLAKTTGGVVSESKEYISDKAAQACPVVEAGTLLMSFKLTLGRMAVAGCDLFTNEAIAALAIKDPSLIDRDYLSYALEAYDWAGASQGQEKVKGKTFNKSSLASVPIDFPRLDEQRRIVATLDEALQNISDLEQNRQRKLKLIEEAFVASLSQVMNEASDTAPTVRLGDACKTGSGGTPLKSRPDFYDGGDIPWLVSGEVGDSEVTQASRFITEAGLSGSSAKLFPPDSVLVAMYGATAGEVGILRIEAATNQAICAILPTEKYTPEFLYFWLLHRKQFLVDQAVGNAQPNISQAKIKDLTLPKISLAEQRAIAEKLHSIQAESSGIKQNISASVRQLASLRAASLRAILKRPMTTHATN